MFGYVVLISFECGLATCRGLQKYIAGLANTIIRFSGPNYLQLSNSFDPN